MRLVKELWDYREMIISLTRRDLKSRYKGSVLGVLWMFVDPLLQLAVYTIVFSTIMPMGIEKFYLFLFVLYIKKNISFNFFYFIYFFFYYFLFVNNFLLLYIYKV